MTLALSIHSNPHHTSYFFSMTPPPPTSTLFPYTTLFRSDRNETGNDGVFDRCCAILITEQLGQHGKHHATSCRDRKSTRLNSSHVSISYAVFCLKKKKK